MEQTPWFERTFAPMADNGLLPGILERLEGTTPRIQYMLREERDDQLAIRLHDRWSVKEEIGHLGDLEELWLGRVDDFDEAKEILRSADLTNRKTHRAAHNKRPWQDLLADFTNQREVLIQRLRSLSSATLERQALHPRLRTPMRVIDLCYFLAEHDDHHIARIRRQLRSNYHSH